VRSLYTYFYNLASQQVQKKGTNRKVVPFKFI
ncbi:hypothetical protein EVA_22147, partial [gut metagenome]